MQIDQSDKKIYPRIPLIGEMAPRFTATTTQGIKSFPDDYKGKYLILFSHPADFTPICSSEFMTFTKHYQEFKNLNANLLGISADSLYSHIAWLKNIKEKLEFKGEKNVEIPFPVIADMDKIILKKFGMIHSNNEFSTRSTFIIGPEGRIRAFMFYPMYNGRSIQEILRLLKAIQKHTTESVATPAEWIPGDDVLDRIPRTFQEAIQKSEKIGKTLDAEKNPKNLKCYEWYDCFRPDTQK